MKNLLIIPVLLISVLSFSQVNKTEVKNLNIEVFKDLKIEVSVDSAEELKNTLSIEKLPKLLALSSSEEDIYFSIVCNNKNSDSSKVIYSIVGNMDEKDNFMTYAEKIYDAALNYYSN